jgi:hypothetical protein
MKTKILSILFAVLSLTPLARPQTAQPTDATVDNLIDNVLSDHAAYHQLFTTLQTAVTNHNPAAVAPLVKYPITVNISGSKTTIHSEKAFIQNYTGIITPTIAEAITHQQYKDLMVNFQGVMIGNGQIWINGICTDKSCKKSIPKIVTIQDTSMIGGKN